MDLKLTPLHAEHVKLGGRMVDFAGWHMPVQYQGVIEEHQAVRTKVGLFDVSHMGEIFVTGPKALECLQWLTSNDVSKLSEGQAQYSLLLNEKGGLVDDIIVYCIKKNEVYLVCVNASNSDKDFSWMLGQNKFKDAKDVKIENQSTIWSQIAIQGPNAVELTARVCGVDVKDIKYFEFMAKVVNGETWYIARTGYTGEDGYEVFLPNGAAVSFWQELMEKGQDLGITPIGLGARDTLRVEMKYSLYGHEITADTSALEAGLGWVIKFAKGDFIGKDALLAGKAKGLSRKLIGLKLIDRGIPRQSYPLYSLENVEIGCVTSGTMSPTLKEPIGIAYIDKAWADEGKEFFVQIRGRNLKAVVVKTPFVSPIKSV